MKITEFDRATCRRMEVLITNALNSNPALAEFGLSFKIDGGSFNLQAWTARLEVGIVGVDAAKKSFETYAPLVGLKPSDHGRKVIIGEREYELVGIQPGRPRYPIQARRVGDGRMFKFERERVIAAMGRDRG